MTDRYLITDREPQALYQFFEDISRIPRVTGNEKEVSGYIVEFAKKRGLWYYQDHMYNVLVRKDASKGFEALPPILLEGHLDMVGAKEEWSSHDFNKDPIELVAEGNILRANGTTLGADNGCAVAVMLTLLNHDGLVHPPLECLFTTQEETGMDGMKGFDINQIRSRRVIGLDAGEEGVFRMGTTTKIEMTSALPVNRETISGNTYEIVVDGLRGESQGESIPKERICAIKMTFRVLHFLNKEMDARVVSAERLGSGIAESCRAVISLESGDECRMREILNQQQDLIRREYRECDPDIRIRAFSVTPQTNLMLTKECSDNLIHSIYLVPYGARNRKPFHHEVSCSVAVKKIYTQDDAIRIYSVISSEEKEQGDALKEEMRTYLILRDWKVEQEEFDYGWDWEEHSPIRDVMVRTYCELFGTEPVVNISHGGNDCVILKQRIPDMDVVTTAATYRDCHTPNEHLYMDSFEKVYALLERTLYNLTKI